MLSRIDKDSKEARDRRIFAAWLACRTYDEIAKAEGIDPKTCREVISGETAILPKPLKAAAEHATDFEPPIYNVWKQQDKDARSPVQPSAGEHRPPGTRAWVPAVHRVRGRYSGPETLGGSKDFGAARSVRACGFQDGEIGTRVPVSRDRDP